MSYFDRWFQIIDCDFPTDKHMLKVSSSKIRTTLESAVLKLLLLTMSGCLSAGFSYWHDVKLIAF